MLVHAKRAEPANILVTVSQYDYVRLFRQIICERVSISTIVMAREQCE
jgi:hypothetical protein